jgi:putative transposase
LRARIAVPAGHASSMSEYRRVWLPGGTFFFTVNLQDRSSDLLVARVDALRAAFARTRRDRPFQLIAAVALPDHLHVLWTLPVGDADNATRWRQIKSLFTRQVGARGLLRQSQTHRREAAIWQRRYWERVIRDVNDLRAHIDYIHYNPVRHGLVERARDWPHSSFHRYVRDGILSADWGTSLRTFAHAAGEHAPAVEAAGRSHPHVQSR